MIEMNRRLLLAALALLFFCIHPAKMYSEERSVPFAQEINRLRSELTRDRLSAKEKHTALRMLAALLSLSGHTDAAAAAWHDASFAEAGVRDNRSLLESAACYIAIGEWEKADAAIKQVMLTARDDKAVSLRARYLAAYIEALQKNNEAALLTLLEDPDFNEMRPVLYWTLWKTSGRKEYGTKLSAAYPLSPETKMYLAEGGAKNGVQEASSPQWMLPSSELTLKPATVAVPSATHENNDPPPLQTGVFNQKKNADNQAARLKKAGFNAEVGRKVSGSSEYWSVTVPSNGNTQQMLMLLKEAGFDAFPVY